MSATCPACGTVNEEFPSPCGERVLLNATDKSDQLRVYIEAFPSPCGERVLLNKQPIDYYLSHRVADVSVPLRGKGSVERRHIRFYSIPATNTFPSPCGERVLLNVGGKLFFQTYHRPAVSVPLRGKGSVEPEYRLLS